MNKAFLPYDVYERHKKVAEKITTIDTVLDVGGELNHLSQFVKPQKLTVANLTTGDVIIKKSSLPFSDKSFDVICAIDVLEHIPKKNRGKFITNLMHIAKKKVILSFPIGTTEHINYEKRIYNLLTNKGTNVQYLKEHIKFGLPKKDEIENLTESYKTKIFYSGNLLLNELLFRFYLFDPKVRIIRKTIYLAKLLLNLISNPILYLFLSNKVYSKNVNRAYLIIFK